MISVCYGTDAKETVEALLEEDEPFASLTPESRVVIKPNIVVAKRQWLGADTRPEVVEVIIRRLQSLGIKSITIAEGSGVGHSASKAFKILGYDALARRYGVELLDIEKDNFVSRRTMLDGPFPSLQISRTVAECDYLINVPVLKAHGETKLTCSLKNLKGVMPKDMKPRFHSVDLHKSVAQLNTILSSDYIIVDGAFGDLSNEMGGTPMEMGIMVSGKDPLEIDSFASGVLGFSPDDILHLKYYAGYREEDLSSYRPERKELNRPVEQRSFTVETDPFKRFPCRVSGEGVCCTCRGNLVFALKRLSERGVLTSRQHFVIGRRGKLGSGEKVAVGDCAVSRIKAGGDDSYIPVGGCPPESRHILERVI